MVEIIVCQHCEEVIDYVQSHKVGTLYGTCPDCDEEESE
ncbi:GapA-binding peptide SR1P [Thermoflavimicrobium dichotomicum]|uniref:SR1 protein n=1 Tax=Thermoflavimicrobium dichotomicum TaxID=46223 RepID=A0A1I3N992_9BACL|nr:SR1 protein [Thermoflavimicrobium dichotomicum]